MRGEDLVCPIVVLEFEYGNIAVGRCAREKTACLVRGPCDQVDRGGVEGDFVDLLPAAGLFAPDEDFAVIRGRGEDVAVFGVGPCYAPDGALVAVAVSGRIVERGDE